MSYKVNLILIIIYIINHTQSYGSYLTYEYLLLLFENMNIYFTIIVY